ncbi:MAG: hypothetical protein ABIJ59_00530 [Pseudomonadota bacterium]
MNFRFIFSPGFLTLLTIMLVGCTTPTISNNISMTPIGNGFVPTDKSISALYLIGGGGLDWGEFVTGSGDGSFYLSGKTRKSFGESTDLLVAKLSSNHKILWAKTYGGSHEDTSYDTIKTRDNGFLILGGSQSLFFTPLPGSKQERPILIKIDDIGDVQWAVTLDREMKRAPIPIKERVSIDTLYSVIQTFDGGYVCVGNSTYISTENEMDIVVAKLSENGEQLWQYRYDLGVSDIGFDIKEMSNGNLLIAANTFNKISKSDIVLLNLDSQGQPLWSKSYSAEQDQIAYHLINSGTGQFIISGLTKDNKKNSNDILCVKFSSNGDVLWSRSYGSQNIDNSNSIINGHKNEYLIVGRSGDYKKNLADGVALLINNDGELLSYEYFGGKLNDELRSGYPIDKERYYLLGATDSYRETYTNFLSAIWSPEKSTPKTIEKTFTQTSQDFETRTESVSYSPIKYQNVHLRTDLKARGLQVKSLSIVLDTE